MLDGIFLRVLEMSLTGSIVILAVCLARLLLKRAPKLFSYALWAVVLIRLLCPVSMEAPVSLVPRTEPAPYTLSGQLISAPDAAEAAYRTVGDVLNGDLGLQHIRTTETDASGLPEYVTADWWEIWILTGQYIWAAGAAVMVLRGLTAWKKLQKKLVGAILLRDNIWLADGISSPFVLGVFRPRVYLPSGLSKQEQAYMLLHEQHHIRRLDHLTRLLAYAALCLHWFSPFCWLAFSLSERDMEMSCDETVLRKMGPGIRADYAASLLRLAAGGRIAAAPLAFGEGDPKGRIKNLARWKKPTVWATAAAALLCAGLAVCLLTDPLPLRDTLQLTEAGSTGGRTHSAVFSTDLGHQVTGVTLTAEQWRDGDGIREAPLTLTQYAEELRISMSLRYEEQRPVGVDVQLSTDLYGGSQLCYFPFPDGLDVRGWSFTSYEEGEKLKLSPGGSKILAALAFDVGGGVRVVDCESLVSEPERLKEAGYMIVIRAEFED